MAAARWSSETHRVAAGQAGQVRGEVERAASSARSGRGPEVDALPAGDHLGIAGHQAIGLREPIVQEPQRRAQIGIDDLGHLRGDRRGSAEQLRETLGLQGVRAGIEGLGELRRQDAAGIPPTPAGGPSGSSQANSSGRSLEPVDSAHGSAWLPRPLTMPALEASKNPRHCVWPCQFGGQRRQVGQAESGHARQARQEAEQRPEPPPTGAAAGERRAEQIAERHDDLTRTAR